MRIDWETLAYRMTMGAVVLALTLPLIAGAVAVSWKIIVWAFF